MNDKPNNNRYSENRNYNERQMFTSKCDECGKNCKLPFKPTFNKPTYCSDCFEKIDKSRKSGSKEVSSNISKQLEDINLKLDILINKLK